MNMSSPAAPDLLARLQQLGYRQIEAEQLAAVAAECPLLLVMLNEDPLKHPEVMDNAVIVPQVLREFPAGAFQVAYADAPHSRSIAQMFGIVKFPALVFLRQGEYVGAILGLLNWSEVVPAFADKLTAAARRPPSVGIPVVSTSGSCA